MISALIFAFFLIVLSIVFGVIYCCLHISTPYDRQVDDLQQMNFIKSITKSSSR